MCVHHVRVRIWHPAQRCFLAGTAFLHCRTHIFTYTRAHERTAGRLYWRRRSCVAAPARRRDRSIFVDLDWQEARHVFVSWTRIDRLWIFTSDGLLSGQIDDHVAGNELARCVSSTCSVELDAKGPQRRHLFRKARRDLEIEAARSTGSGKQVGITWNEIGRQNEADDNSTVRVVGTACSAWTRLVRQRRRRRRRLASQVVGVFVSAPRRKRHHVVRTVRLSRRL